MSIRFETEINHDTDRPRLVIRSSHHTIGGAMQNMLGKPGSPMLDIADAVELRGKLDAFILEVVK